MANQKKHRWLPYLMVLPAFSIMVLVVVFPIVNTVARSFRTTDGRFTLDNYVYFFTSAEALQSLLFTLAEALTVMALSVVLSFLLALYLRFSKSPVSRALGKLYLLPRFIPGIAAVYAVMNVIKDSGSINRIAAAFGVDYKPGLLYDLKGIILSNLWFCIPFAAMMMSAALSSVNDSYVESARDAGCSWRDSVPHHSSADIQGRHRQRHLYPYGPGGRVHDSLPDRPQQSKNAGHPAVPTNGHLHEL